MSISSFFFVFYSIIFCFTNFLNSLILISFNFNSFYFSLKINSFLSYSVLFNCNSFSISLILSCQTFYPYFFSTSNFFISSSSYVINSFEIESLLLLPNCVLTADFPFCFSFIPFSFIASFDSSSRIFCFFST